MNNHPLNLAVRFILEILLLGIFAYWSWNKCTGAAKHLLSIGLPLIAAIIWAVFKVNGDPDKAIVAIPGWLRLLYEFTLFAAASYMLFNLKLDKWAYCFIIVSVLHYLFSYDRIIWLLKN